MDSSIRLITIIAPGGMGKTRLALQSVAQHVERFEHGAYFVDLAAVTEPERIVNAIGDAVDFNFQQTNGTPQAQLEHFLSSRELLLILDNYEHLMEGASLVTDLLKAAPRLKILVTSRQRLNQSSEYVLSLVGFAADDWPTPEAALNSAAVRLFMQGARRVQPDFELTPHNLKPVTRICQQVGGLPLGIVLAASWLGMLTPAEIVDEITAGVEFLEADMGDLPARQRSIRAVFNYSWGLLSEAERDTFMRLSVFKGGFTREAAQAVSGASLRMLMMLVNKSLLRRDTTSGRYSLHELLRQFAEVRLRESGTEDDTRATHAHYYLANLTSRRDIFIGWGKHNMLNVEFIAVEMPNITQAWYYAVERRMIEELEVAETVLSWFRELRSMFATFEPMLEAAYEMLLTVPDTPRKHSLLMHTLMWQSWNALRLGKLERTLAKSRASIQLFETKSIKIKDEAQTTPYAALAVALALMGRIDEARAAAQRNQEVFLNEPSSKLAMAYYALTAVELAAQNYEAVRTAAQKGYKLFVQFRQFYLCCYLLNNWGDAEMALGNDDKARALFEESYDYMAHIGVPEGMATAQTRIADIAMRQGDADLAQRIYEECVETYSRLGDQGGLARSLAQLAQIALDDARITKAARLQAAALEATGAGLGSMTLETLFGAATLLRSTGHSNTAHTILATIVAHPAVSHDLQQAALIALEGATAETTSLEVLVTQAAWRLRQVAHDDLMGSKRT
jgi:predicted ATPase